MFTLHMLLLCRSGIFQLTSEMKKETFFVSFFFSCHMCGKLWITTAQSSKQQAQKILKASAELPSSQGRQRRAKPLALGGWARGGSR